MLWLKAFHVVFVVTWFAGLFYLPRLFVYHAVTTDAPGIARFVVMERRLFFLMSVGAVLAHPARLPDAHPLLRLYVQLVPRLHVERLIPVVDVGQRAVDAELRRAVLIRDHHLAQCAVAVFLAP